MSAKAYEVLETLDKFKRNRPPRGRAGLELRAHRISIYAVSIALALTAFMVFLGGWHNFIAPLPYEGRQIAFVFGGGALLAAVIFMLVQTLEMVLGAIAIKKHMFADLILELDWSVSQADELSRYQKNDLKRAQELLELKVHRSRERIKSVMGGPDKFTLVAVLAASAAAFKEYPALVPYFLSAWFGKFDFVKTLCVVVVSFLIGIVIGAILLNLQVQRYVHQLEVLKLHLSTLEQIS